MVPQHRLLHGEHEDEIRFSKACSLIKLEAPEDLRLRSGSGSVPSRKKVDPMNFKTKQILKISASNSHYPWRSGPLLDLPEEPEKTPEQITP